jgi:zinc protease
LVKNFEASIALLNEMLLKPRWDLNEFERIKSRRLTSIKQSKVNANSIAAQAFFKQLYGAEHLAGMPTGGTLKTVENIELDDLKAYYTSNFTPKNATFHIVGDIKREQVEKALVQLADWQGGEVAIPQQAEIENVSKPKLFFIDLPKAKQSVIYMGKAVVPGDNNNFYPIEFANMRLGGGISARLAQTLRIEKGYTYGAYSYLLDSSYQSPFVASSQVRTNVTLESLQIFKKLVGEYKETYTEEDLAVAKNMTIKSNSRRFETLNSLLGMLETISRFDKAKNYIEQEQNFVINAELIDVQSAIENFLDEQEMIYLVVGDAESQLKRMSQLGYGEPILLDIDGNRI